MLPSMERRIFCLVGLLLNNSGEMFKTVRADFRSYAVVWFQFCVRIGWPRFEGRLDLLLCCAAACFVSCCVPLLPSSSFCSPVGLCWLFLLLLLLLLPIAAFVL